MLEQIYKLRGKGQGDTELISCRMMDFKPGLEKLIASLSPEQIKTINQSASTEMAIIAYLNARLKFRGSIVLNYAKYKRINEIVRILLNFTSVERVDVRAKISIGELCFILSELDEAEPSMTKNLSYMYLRLFITMVIFGNYSDASILADLILNQLITYKAR